MTHRIGSLMRLLMGFVLVTLSFPAAALTCATPGKDGAGGVLNATINRYWPATFSAGVGATSITLGSSIGSGAAIADGDLLLVIQMQDAAINSTNTDSYGNGTAGDPGSGSTALNSAGLYEFVRATTAVPTTGGTVNLVGGSGGGLLNAYNNAAAFGTQGQRRFQVVRVPQYTTAILGSGLTATAWNGTAGGVLVFDVAGALTLGGATVSVNGLGMRGGGARQLGGGAGARTDYRTLSTVNNNGSKGEGIAGTPRWVNNAGTTTAASDTGVEGYPNGSHARGAPGNAGGGGTDGDPAANDENTGGGGGSNAGTGGKGGNAWDGGTGPHPTGGWGGFDYSGSVGPGRLFLGGGGGSGTTNNGTGSPGTGFASSGAAGGGLVMIRAGSITGSATISANGANANNTVTNDGSGGGGAGGSVLVYSGGGSVGALAVQATGGTGGTNTGGGSAHGPGGGGSGGYVATSGAASITVSGGAAGTTSGGVTHGATAGTSGTSTTALLTGDIRGVKSGAECAIKISKSFSPTPMGNGRTATLTVTLVSSNDLAITGIVLNDIFPTTPGAMTVASPLATTNACGGSLLDSGGTTLAAADVGVRLNAGTLSANATCTFSVGITATVLGEYTNTIPVGVLTSTNGGTNAVAASAVLTVVGPSLVFLKAVAVFSDPSNGTTNPKNIPGAFVDYTLRVTNTGLGTVTLDTVVITDPIPANTELFINSLGASPVNSPVAFVDSVTPPSGVTFAFTSLNNTPTADDIEFSNQAPVAGVYAFGYLPVPNALGVDPAVTAIRLNPKGTMAGASGVNNPFFDLTFRVRVK